MDKSWKKFERKVAEGFSRWLSGGRCSTALARQSLLGRMVERRHGDLAPHPDCPERHRPAVDWFMRTFQVDAKRRKAFALESVLCQPGHVMWLWWSKLRRDTEPGKFPLMVLTAPRGAAVVVMGLDFLKFLEERAGDVLHPRAVVGEVFMVSFNAWLGRVGEPEVLGCPARRM